MKVFRLAAFIISGTVAGAMHADPIIQSVTGTLADGATITIKGSAFGSARSAPLVWDAVENLPAYKSLASGTSAPTTDGVWEYNGSSWASPLLVIKPSSAERGRSAYYSATANGYWGWSPAMRNANAKKIYASWWMKPGAAITPGGSNKFIRVWDDPNGNGTRISWCDGHLDYNGVTNWGDSKLNVGQWNRLELYADATSGKIEAKINGQVLFSKTNFVKATNSYGLNVHRLGWDPVYPEKFAGTVFGMSDIYMSDTQARVEVSNKETWSTSGAHAEIQPVASWVDGSITAKLNLKPFAPGEKLYVYVIDAQGQVNARGLDLSVLYPPRAPQLQVQ